LEVTVNIRAPYRPVSVLAACLIGICWSQAAAAGKLSFKVALSGTQCVPPVEGGATGTADITYEPDTRVVTWSITYAGTSGRPTMAHLHGPAAPGKNGPVAVWLTRQGSPAESLITGEATLTPVQAEQFIAGEWYINVHTQAHPGCELRGAVTPPKS
jgi:hypothetical protein